MQRGSVRVLIVMANNAIARRFIINNFLCPGFTYLHKTEVCCAFNEDVFPQ
jgi:hypothetical protein